MAAELTFYVGGCEGARRLIGAFAADGSLNATAMPFVPCCCRSCKGRQIAKYAKREERAKAFLTQRLKGSRTQRFRFSEHKQRKDKQLSSEMV